MYKNKYLKYKNKYLKLKTVLNALWKIIIYQVDVSYKIMIWIY
jgi:cell fate (sporulation/competence/biofilm development) regulator YlbF (YheA/YmcA/DUF963 family)